MVVFIAIAASEIAASHGNQVREHGVAGGKQSAANEANLSKLKLYEFAFPHVADELETRASGKSRVVGPNFESQDRRLRLTNANRCVWAG
jgi:hypothetical protein